MNGEKVLAWAVEYVEHDQRNLYVDYVKHSTPEEAKDAIASHLGIPWKELEKRGAKLIQQEITVYPGMEPSMHRISGGADQPEA